jgi:hypothetical protein
MCPISGLYLKLGSFGPTMLPKVACTSWPVALTHPGSQAHGAWTVSTSESTVFLLPAPVRACTLAVRPSPSRLVVVQWVVPLLFVVVAVVVHAPEV